MANKFHKMDEMTSDEVAVFKGKARRGERQLDLVLEGAPSPAPFSTDEDTAGTSALLGATEGARPNIGAIVAEGDSWFNYLPGTDVIDCLISIFGYSIENFASPGDTLENMIYGTRIDNHFQRLSPTIDEVLRKLGQLKPKVFLFSGGGNDVAGEEFESYLNHRDSGLPKLRTQFINNMVNVVFYDYFEDLIEKVGVVSPDTHIITHGYGHTIPTGIGVNWWGFNFAGPWLRPALAKKGIFDPIEQQGAVKAIINKYNNMLASLVVCKACFDG